MILIAISEVFSNFKQMFWVDLNPTRSEIKLSKDEI